MYGAENREKYLPEYYHNMISPLVDKAYLIQCVRLYGLDPEKVTTFRGNPVDFEQWEKDTARHIEHLE